MQGLLSSQEPNYTGTACVEMSTLKHGCTKLAVTACLLVLLPNYQLRATDRWRDKACPACT